MSEFQDAIHESLSDNIHHLMQIHDDNCRIVQADDYIKIIAPIKKPNGRYLSVVDDYITAMLDDDTCSRTIAGYRHISTGTYFDKHDLTVKANLNLYSPVYKLTIKPDENTTIIYDRNNITICIYRLPHCTESRYRQLVDTLINCYLFVHKSRTDCPDSNQKYNSMLQVIKRDFKMFEYEWSFTFNAEITRALLPAIKRPAVQSVDGCFYLNRGKRVQCKIKVYNITALNTDRKKQNYQFKTGDQLKLELTYTSEYFRSRPGLSIATFKKQKDAFFALHTDNMRLLSKKILNKMQPSELKNTLNTAKVKSKTEFLEMIRSEQTMQTRIDIDINEIRRKQSALEKMVAENKADADERFTRIEQFIGLHDTMTDKRKLRLV